MTDIPEYMMKDADNCFKSILNIEMDRNEMVAVIARAMMDARDKALEDAAAVAYDKTEDCEHADTAAEWYRGYASACRGIAETLCAMKSSARQDAGIDKPELSE